MLFADPPRGIHQRHIGGTRQFHRFHHMSSIPLTYSLFIRVHLPCRPHPLHLHIYSSLLVWGILDRRPAELFVVRFHRCHLNLGGQGAIHKLYRIFMGVVVNVFIRCFVVFSVL